MIFVTRLDGHEMLVNPHLISMAEATPDTVLTFTTGSKLMVKERLGDIADRIVAYQRRVHADGVPGLREVGAAPTARPPNPDPARARPAEDGVSHG